MRRNAAVSFLIAHARIDQVIHPHNDLIGG
jgi:hypothetical protein